MSKESEKDKPDDPLDIRKGASGVLALVIVCGFLWALSKFGPKGANWITEQMTGTSAASISTPDKTETEPKQEKPKPEAEPEVVAETEPEKAPKVAEAETPDPVPAPTVPAKSKSESAEQQLLEALGGSKNALVRHIAFSDDEASMVALVKFLDGKKKGETVEIYFDKDNFSRYISVPDSPIEQEITIWTKK